MLKLLRNRLLFVLGLCVATHSFAQQKNFILRTMDWGYRIVQGDSSKPYKKYFFPIPIVAYKPETRWILGLSTTQIFRASHDSITRPSFVRLNIAYSQERQFSVRPQLEIFSRNNRYHIRSIYQYTDFAEYQWGVGKDMPASNKELYSFRMHKGFVKAARLIAPNVYAGVQYLFEHMYDVRYISASLHEGRYYGSNGYTASGLGYTVYYDNRDNVYFPYNGVFMEITNDYFHPAIGSGSRFSNLIIDGRFYKQLWRENILATQVYGQHNWGQVPFRMLGTLGNEMFMRGYYSGRYRDMHAVSIHSELRKTIWGPIGCVVFGGFGAVSGKLGTLHEKPIYNYGVGLRVKAIPRERINMRIDYARGTAGNSTVYITLNEAF